MPKMENHMIPKSRVNRAPNTSLVALEEKIERQFGIVDTTIHLGAWP
jgi:hypothetical protein